MEFLFACGHEVQPWFRTSVKMPKSRALEEFIQIPQLGLALFHKTSLPRQRDMGLCPFSIFIAAVLGQTTGRRGVEKL